MPASPDVVVTPVSVRDDGVVALVDALTAELAESEYSEDETFGYSAEKLAESGVHLVGARLEGVLVGIGGIEIQDGGHAELKRMYVDPGCRGRGVADAIMTALVDHAVASGTVELRLETGDKQHAAMGFYRRHGFVVVDRFPPYVDSATSVCMSRDVG